MPPKRQPRPRKGRPRSTDVDWDAIERLYVQGEFDAAPDGSRTERRLPSYADLAKRFGLRTASIADRGRINLWSRKRDEFTASLAVEADQKRIESVSSAVVETTKRTLALGDKLLDEIEAQLNASRAARSFAVPVTPPAPGEAPPAQPEPPEALDPAAIRHLTTALRTLVETRRIELHLDPSGGDRGAAGGPDAAAVRDRAVTAQIRARVVKHLLDANQAPRTHGAPPPAGGDGGEG